MQDMITLNPPEKSRTYHFPTGKTVVLRDVTHFLDRPSNHRLKTADGKLHIVCAGWIHIEIEAMEWTV